VRRNPREAPAANPETLPFPCQIDCRFAAPPALWYVLRMAANRMEQLKSILAEDPRNTFARYALGMEYSSAGQTDAALLEFLALLQLDANYANAFFMGALALQHADRIQEAVAWLRDGIVCAHRVGNRHAESEMQTLLEELES
jgi:tetratricopeptide (TPR) repeat protein